MRIQSVLPLTYMECLYTRSHHSRSLIVWVCAWACVAHTRTHTLFAHSTFDFALLMFTVGRLRYFISVYSANMNWNYALEQKQMQCTKPKNFGQIISFCRKNVHFTLKSHFQLLEFKDKTSTWYRKLNSSINWLHSVRKLQCDANYQKNECYLPWIDRCEWLMPLVSVFAPKTEQNKHKQTNRKKETNLNIKQFKCKRSDGSHWVLWMCVNWWYSKIIVFFFLRIKEKK